MSRTSSHLAVDDITAGKSSAVIPSFTDDPSGAEKFKIILAEPFGFCLHIMPFTLAPCSGSSNGPFANPFVIQAATASVISAGNLNALSAFLLKDAFRKSPLHPISAPFSKSSILRLETSQE